MNLQSVSLPSDQRLQLSADPGSAVSEVQPGHDERSPLHRVHDGTLEFQPDATVLMSEQLSELNLPPLPHPDGPGARGQRVLSVGARGGGVRLPRHRRHPRVEESDHAGPEPQLHQQHRRLCGEERFHQSHGQKRFDF